MDLQTTPITLPLDRDINRCLAHGDNPTDWCERRFQCACHETIKHDRVPVPTAYRKCRTDTYAAFLPLAGYAETDSEGGEA